MNNPSHSYKIRWIVSGIIIWEVIFWILYYVLLAALGLFSKGGSSERLLYKQPEVLYALGFLLPIIGVFLYNILQNNKIAGMAKSKTAQSFLRPVSSLSAFIKYLLFRNAFVLLVIAMAQPVFGSKKVSGTAQSLELVVALDVSNSMNTRDISEDISRLDISKRAMVQLINSLGGEKIGICLFANSAFVQLPITSDYGAAKMFIQDIESNMISSQGTNIKAAVEVSHGMFSKEKTTKAIILITDGENHEENPNEALAKLKEDNVQLCVLGIGTEKGGLVPKNAKRPELGYKTDATGKTVLSKLNKSFINQVAQKGGGLATISDDEFPNLSALLTQISQMKRTKIDNFEFDIKQERYQVPLLISIVCWLGYLLWSRQYDGFLKRTHAK